jgi:hypothetical protein
LEHVKLAVLCSEVQGCGSSCDVGSVDIGAEVFYQALQHQQKAVCGSDAKGLGGCHAHTLTPKSFKLG